jgi:hypothetical protein
MNVVVVMVFVADQGQDCTNTGTTISFRQHQEQSIERWARVSQVAVTIRFRRGQVLPKVSWCCSCLSKGTGVSLPYGSPFGGWLLAACLLLLPRSSSTVQ